MKSALVFTIMIVVFAVLANAETIPQSAPATQPSSAAPTTQPGLVPAAQLLQQMLRPANGPEVQPLLPILNAPVIDQTSGKTVVPGSAPVATLKREGDYITERMGRLTKSTDGAQMEFTFDADGQNMQDPPMILLPNLKLMAMENATNNANRDLRFRVTGPVTEYKGRNYLLLEKVSVVPDAQQQF